MTVVMHGHNSGSDMSSGGGMDGSGDCNVNSGGGPDSSRRRYNWFFSKQELRNTPSMQKGLDFEVERSYREDGARIIGRVGNLMNLHYSTIATGIVYYHRFYMIHTFQSYPRFVTAAACLFLAGKVEETPKKGKDIVKAFKDNLPPRQTTAFGEEGKEEILIIEKVLLQTIDFDMDIEHPYNFLVIYSRIFSNYYDKVLLQNIVQMAWTFTNDSFYTMICMQWEPEIVAIAMLYLSFKINKIQRIYKWEGKKPYQRNWWDNFVENLSISQVEDICHNMLDYYSKDQDNGTPGRGLPTFVGTAAAGLQAQQGSQVPKPPDHVPSPISR